MWSEYNTCIQKAAIFQNRRIISLILSLISVYTVEGGKDQVFSRKVAHRPPCELQVIKTLHWRAHLMESSWMLLLQPYRLNEVRERQLDALLPGLA